MVATPTNSQTLDQVETPSARLHAALDLMEFGIELMRGNLRRRMPLLSSTELAAELQAWIEKPLGQDLYYNRQKP